MNSHAEPTSGGSRQPPPQRNLATHQNAPKPTSNRPLPAPQSHPQHQRHHQPPSHAYTPQNQYNSNRLRQFTPTPYSDDEQNRILTMLNKVLGPEYVSFRPGGGGQKVSYIEGWKALNLANEVFGFNGWSSELISTQVDFFDTHGGNGRFLMGLSVVVRITIKDGTYHEDFGYGFIENAKNKAMAFEKCKKEAFTDGLKRCLRCFGNVLGNCLYDKSLVPKLNKFKLQDAELESRHFHRDPLIVERINRKKQAEMEVIASSREIGEVHTGNESTTTALKPQMATSNRTNPVEPVASTVMSLVPSKTHPNIPNESSKSNQKQAGNAETEVKAAEIEGKDDMAVDFDDSFMFSDDILDDQANDGLDLYEMEMLEQKNQPNPDLVDEDASETVETVETAETSTETSAETTTDTSKETSTDTNIAEMVPQNVTFVSAKAADLIQKNPDDLGKVAQFDPKFMSPNIRRTVDHSKSTPIKRSSGRVSKPGLASKGHLQPSQLTNISTPGLGKRMLGLPPSQRTRRFPISQEVEGSVD